MLVSDESGRRFSIGTALKFSPDLLVKVRSGNKESFLWAFELLVPDMDLFGGDRTWMRMSILQR